MKIRFLILTIFSWLSVAVSAQKLDLVAILPYGNEHNLYAHLDCGSKQLQEIAIVQFRMSDGYNQRLYTAVPLENGYYVFPLEDTANMAYRVRAVFTDGSTIITDVMEKDTGERFVWLGSDYKWSAYTTGYSPDTPRIDGSIDYMTNPFPVNGTSYYKSFSTHGKGSFTFDFPENTPYCRFFTYYGIQDNKSKGDVLFSMSVNGEKVDEQMMYSKSNTGGTGPYIRAFETEINGATKILLNGEVVDDYEQDHMNFLLGRIYMKPDTRKEQTSDLPSEAILVSEQPFTHNIEANFTSGGEVIYRLLSGTEYATLSGNVLDVHTLPTDKQAYIEVEAFQPGNDEYKPAGVYRCKYYVRNNKVVQSTEKLVLQDGDEVDELLVYANPESAGQVVVEDGLAKINKLIMKYTFVPGNWNFISFPGNFNIDEVSNMNELGYTYNSSPKPYYIREYSTKVRAEGKSAWVKLDSPEVMKNKGYIMGVARTADNPNSDPVEVTFTFENTVLGMGSSAGGTMEVQLDFRSVEPGATVPVYVRPDGIKGAPLKVMVQFQPTDLSYLPMNYEKELEDARVTYNPPRTGIRITLPDSSPAKVLIFGRHGKLVKAVKYKSPFVIDISDLKPGDYEMLIEYGNARGYKEFTVD